MRYNIDVPVGVQYILDILDKNGHEGYVVGGCVRDALMSKQPHDWDICTSASPDVVLALFKQDKVIETGLKHGTVTVVKDDEPYEVTTYRIDGSYTDGRHPDGVTFTRNLVDDLARRDFTMNAMAYNNGTLIDPFGGAEDLKNKTIRCVGDSNQRFIEDGLRIMRALRFSSALGFSIDEKCKMSVHDNLNLLCNISKERINTELCKLIMGVNVEQVLLEYSDVFAYIVPSTGAMMGFQQHNKYHVYDVWGHTARAVAASASDLVVRLALLLHDIGKPECFTLEEGIGHFYGHAHKSQEIAESVLKELKFSNEILSSVVQLVGYHDSMLIASKPAVKRWLNKIGEMQTRRLLEVQRGDVLGQCERYHAERLQRLKAFESLIDEVVADEACFSLKDLAITGNDIILLGFEPGKIIGKILNDLLLSVIDGELKNEKNELLQTAIKYQSKAL